MLAGNFQVQILKCIVLMANCKQNHCNNQLLRIVYM